jgi:hypothetical protein
MLVGGNGENFRHGRAVIDGLDGRLRVLRDGKEEARHQEGAKGSAVDDAVMHASARPVHFCQDLTGDPSKVSGIGVIFGSDKME